MDDHSFALSKPADHALIAAVVNGHRSEREEAGRRLPSRLLISIRPGLDTAAWAFRDGYHRIVLGDAVLPWAGTTALPLAEMFKLYRGLYRHEVAHAEHSLANFPALRAICARAGASFELLNLFEDARVEHLERQLSGEPFGWSEFRRVPLRPQSPLQALAAEVESEGLSPVPATIWGSRIANYLERIQACSTTAALEPVLRDWVREFDTGRRLGAELSTITAGRGEFLVSEALAKSLAPLERAPAESSQSRGL